MLLVLWFTWSHFDLILPKGHARLEIKQTLPSFQGNLISPTPPPCITPKKIQGNTHSKQFCSAETLHNTVNCAIQSWLISGKMLWTFSYKAHHLTLNPSLPCGPCLPVLPMDPCRQKEMYSQIRCTFKGLRNYFIGLCNGLCKYP